MAAVLDPVVDVLEEGSHPLDSLFKPKRVAVIGATDREGSVGRTLLRNLISNPFGGVVYPVNPKREHVLGISSFKSIAACPGQIDLAVVITPAATVPAVIQDCLLAHRSSDASFDVVLEPGLRGQQGRQLWS